MNTLAKTSSPMEKAGAQYYIKLAEKAVAEQNWEDAIASYQLALQDSPQEADVYVRLGRIYHHVNQDSSAANCFYQALNLAPERASGMGYFHLGNTFLTQGKLDLAFVCYRKAIKQDPHQAEFHHALGQALAEQQMWNAAIASYHQALDLAPDTAKVCHDIAMALIQAHHLEEAQSYLQKTVELDSSAAKSYWELAKLWKRKGNIKEEVHCCLKALQKQPNFTKPYVHLRYNCLRYDISQNSDLLNDVITCCNQVIEQRSDCTWAHSLLGYALTNKGEVEAAIPHYQTASCKKAMRRRPDISADEWKSALRKAPDFLIIGGFKCATTSLYQYLNHHPQVLPTLEKELDFFDLEFERGLDWYLAQLPPIPQTSAFLTGEATPNYLYCPQAPQRIIEAFPDIKLIIILRDPIDRAVSHYHFVPQNEQKPQSIEQVFLRQMKQLQAAIDKGKLSLQHLNQHRYLGHGLYVYPLQKWLSNFEKKNVLVLQQETLSTQPSTVLNSAFSFLGLPEYHLPEHQRYKLGRYDPIRWELRQSLKKFFQPHNQKLEDCLGIALNY